MTLLKDFLYSLSSEVSFFVSWIFDQSDIQIDSYSDKLSIDNLSEYESVNLPNLQLSVTWKIGFIVVFQISIAVRIYWRDIQNPVKHLKFGFLKK